MKKKNIKKKYVNQINESVSQLLSQYKNLVTPGEKDIEEILSHIETRLMGFAIDFSEITETRRKMIEWNVRQYNRRIKAHHFLVYGIPNTDESSKYYKYGYKNDLSFPSKAGIYIVIERATKYIESNCDYLFLELKIMLGISDEAYNNETIDLLVYLSYYKEWIKVMNRTGNI